MQVRAAHLSSSGPATASSSFQVLNLSPALATGLILVSCCPGGQVRAYTMFSLTYSAIQLPSARCPLTRSSVNRPPDGASCSRLKNGDACAQSQASNVATYIAHGDVALSVLMTTASTVGAIFMTPFLTKFLAGALVPVDAVVRRQPKVKERKQKAWLCDCADTGQPKTKSLADALVPVDAVVLPPSHDTACAACATLCDGRRAQRTQGRRLNRGFGREHAERFSNLQTAEVLLTSHLQQPPPTMHKADLRKVQLEV